MAKQHIRRFAEGTRVDPAKSRLEIEKLVRKHGATGFMSAYDKNRYVIVFAMNDRQLKFELPAPTSKEYRTVEKWQAEERRRWRSLLLILKAKLEIVASGDASLDQEFLAYTMLPGGDTFGAKVLPEIQRIIDGGDMPPLLPPAGE